MRDQHIISERENGCVRVFKMNESASADDPIFSFQRAIGARQLRVEDVQRVEIADLGDMALSDFLTAGYDPDRQSFDPIKEGLDDLSGVVFVVRSSAFIDRPVTLTVTGQAQLIAMFREHGSKVAFEPLPNESARGPVMDEPQKMTPSDAAMGGRVATVALLVMAILVWVMIKIAG